MYKRQLLEGEKFKDRIISTMVRDIVIKKEKDGNYLVTVQYNYANSKELPNEESYSVPESIGSQDVELVDNSGVVTNRLRFYPYYFEETFIFTQAS